MPTVVDSFDPVSRLQPRDAFFGGLTSTAMISTKVYYYVFTSLEMV